MADDTEIVTNAVAFLRLAAVELRRIADLDPVAAGDLRHTADQCRREADTMAEHFGLPPPLSHRPTCTAPKPPGEPSLLLREKRRG